MKEVGKQYGDLLCIEYLGKNDYGQNLYQMECTKCKRQKKMKEYLITQNRGTYHSACGKGMKTKNKAFYSRWETMRNRTNGEAYHARKHYKDRGINSDEFKLFIDFYDAMYESFVEHAKIYGEKNTSLERIDVNKSYTKENCKWVTLAEQKGNTQRNREFTAISPDGEIFVDKNLTKFCREHNLPRGTANGVLKNELKHCHNWKFKYNE